MTIRHLKIFLKVAETGNMSLAAKQLYLSQPTVSQAIRELEEHYDTQLFERLSKRLFITDAGKELLLYSRQVLHDFDKLEQGMVSATHHETLRIGASVTVGTCLLPFFLQDLKKEHPQVVTTNAGKPTAPVPSGKPSYTINVSRLHPSDSSLMISEQGSFILSVSILRNGTEISVWFITKTNFSLRL